MKKSWIVSLLLLFNFLLPLTADDNVVGFWQSMDKKTKKPSSVIAFYKYEGKVYGKIIGTYNDQGVIADSIYHPKARAPGVPEHPYYCGLDIVWDGIYNSRGEKYNGKVLDPRKGKVYDADIWRDGNTLILRGKLFVFGKNVKFPAFPEENFNDDFKKPDLSKLVPNVPESMR
jgi:uncharacterized protein (DUF2147 family)